MVLAAEERTRRSGRVTVNSVGYAAGLFWQPADDPNRVAIEARSVAQTEGVDADFYCVITAPQAQYGLGWKDAGHTAGLRPLAFAVAATLDGDFIGAFQIGSQWWFGYARNGVILPDGDALYDNEADCRAHFEREFAEVTEEVDAYAPDAWQIAGTRALDIDAAVGAAPGVKLRSTESVLARVRSLILLAVLLVVAGGFGVYYLLQQAEQREQVIQQNNRLYAEAKRNERPWIREPTPSQVINTCHEVFNRLPIVVPGWSMRNASCLQTPGNPLVRRVQANWEIGDGFIQALRVAAEATQFTPNLGPSGETAVLQATVQLRGGRAQRGKDVPYQGLWVGSRIQNTLWELENRLSVEGAETASIELQGSPPRGTRRKAVDSEGKPFDDVYQAPPTLGITVISNLPIRTWNRLFDAIPGLIVDNIEWNTQNGEWTINARVYAKYAGDA